MQSDPVNQGKHLYKLLNALVTEESLSDIVILKISQLMVKIHDK